MISRTNDIRKDFEHYIDFNQGPMTPIDDVHDIFRLHTDVLLYLVGVIDHQRNMNTELLKRLDELNKELAEIHGTAGEDE